MSSILIKFYANAPTKEWTISEESSAYDIEEHEKETLIIMLSKKRIKEIIFYPNFNMPDSNGGMNQDSIDWILSEAQKYMKVKISRKKEIK